MIGIETLAITQYSLTMYRQVTNIRKQIAPIAENAKKETTPITAQN